MASRLELFIRNSNRVIALAPGRPVTVGRGADCDVQLSGGDEVPASEIALLKRAQRHLSTLHRVSELLAGARDIEGLSDATLRAMLEVVASGSATILPVKASDQ